VYSPVCGADKNTWGSDCAAKCAGVAVASAGECGKQVVAADAADTKKAKTAAPSSVLQTPKVAADATKVRALSGPKARRSM